MVKPPLNKVYCVRKDLTDMTNITDLGTDSILDVDGLNVHGPRDGFVVRNGTYSLVIYVHPDEPYLPSSVDWFFQNGALVYRRGNESNPNPIQKNNSKLPQGGSNDDAYWLDLPCDSSSQDIVKKESLQDASTYFHVKPIFDGILIDIIIWVFYPFNGGARAKLEFINLSLGKLVEHMNMSP
ncbi:hypothetical protein L1887_18747 [Cichorium endivia]|nr:hypothetical protein L1887_18747 [Cichorium endivia]